MKESAIVMDPTDNLENPLWKFACFVWEDKECQATLMHWQNACDLRVNVCLAALWLTVSNIDQRPAFREATATTQSWHETKVLPLRAMRTSLDKNETNSALIRALLGAEIEAEKYELQAIYRELKPFEMSNIPSSQGMAQLSSNFLNYLNLVGELDIDKERDKISQLLTCGLRFLTA